MNERKRHLLITPLSLLSLLSLTAISGAILASSTVNADNDTAIDQINIRLNRQIVLLVVLK